MQLTDQEVCDLLEAIDNSLYLTRGDNTIGNRHYRARISNLRDELEEYGHRGENE